MKQAEEREAGRELKKRSVHPGKWMLLLAATAGLWYGCRTWDRTPQPCQVRGEMPESVPQYRPFECRVDLQALPENPWDPEKTGLRAEIRTPGGEVLKIYPFYDQEHKIMDLPPPPLSPIQLLRIYCSPSAWTDAKELTLFIDDMKLVRKGTGEAVMLSDFEGDTEGWSGGGVVSSENVHSGKQSLEAKLDLAGEYPGVSLRPTLSDWSDFKEMHVSVFPKTDATAGTLNAEFWQDFEKKIKTSTTFSTATRALKLNAWNELVWNFSAAPLPQKVVPMGEPHFCFRMALQKPGKHKITLFYEDSVVCRQTVNCRPAAGLAPVRISPINPRYFETAEGDSLFFIGENSSFPTKPSDLAGYERVFPKLRKAGCNYVRFWMQPAQSLENQEVGQYPLEKCFLYDKAISTALENDLYCLFCMQFFGDLSKYKKNAFWNCNVWEKNPYNAALGGPCPERSDFMTSEEAKRFFRQRLRYIVARYGAYLNIAAWQFWNEVDCMDNYDSAAATRWHAEMGRYTREIDPYKHLITTSCGKGQRDPQLWALDDLDFIQTHTYIKGDKAREVHDLIGFWASYGKPYFPGEFGINWTGALPTLAADPEGLHLHNGFWSSLVSGGAGTPMSWWWYKYVDDLNLYHHFIPVVRFLKDLPLSKRIWREASIHELRYIASEQDRQMTFSDLVIAPSTDFFYKPETSVFPVTQNGTLGNESPVSKFLHAKDGPHADISVPLVFEVDYHEPGLFAIHVDKVSVHVQLEIRLDGKLVLNESLPAGERLGKRSSFDETYKIWNTTYDTDFTVDIPAGKHRIKIDNTGKDWLTVDKYTFEKYQSDEFPPLHVFGQLTDDMAILWVQNKNNAAYLRRPGRKVHPVEPSSFVLEGMTDGNYRLEHWDTAKGTVIETKNISVQGGNVRLDMPLIHTDIALKALRR